ncbi:MAG: hypothetical protein ACLFS4_01625 [Opitutales bacterium]
MIFAQMPSQAPELPPGPSLEEARGPIEVPALEPWQILTLALLGIIALALLLWMLRALLRRYKKPAPATAPHTAAFAELDEATEAGADDERFAVLSSRALRRYLENGARLAPQGRTTEECLHEMKQDQRLDDDAKELLTRFLAECDRIKFARHQITPEERDHLTDTARQLVRRIHRHLNEEPASASASERESDATTSQP